MYVCMWRSARICVCTCLHYLSMCSRKLTQLRNEVDEKSSALAALNQVVMAVNEERQNVMYR
jgi:hypothetical protein